jgi:hypothetical protein
MGQTFQDKKATLDIDVLLHPSKAFGHPLDVVRDPDMTIAEKRAVLVSWASDACAIASNPALRVATTGNAISYDDIIDAFQSLNVDRSSDAVTYNFKRRQRRRRWTKWKDSSGRSNGDVGSSAFG